MCNVANHLGRVRVQGRRGGSVADSWQMSASDETREQPQSFIITNIKLSSSSTFGKKPPAGTSWRAAREKEKVTPLRGGATEMEILVYYYHHKPRSHYFVGNGAVQVSHAYVRNTHEVKSTHERDERRRKKTKTPKPSMKYVFTSATS
jgi:hypothetical protein